MKELYSFPTLKKDLGYFFKEQCPSFMSLYPSRNGMDRPNPLNLTRILKTVIGDDCFFGKIVITYHDKCDILVERGIIDGNTNKHIYLYRHSFVFNDEFIETIARIIHNGMTIVNKMYEITTVKGVKRLENPVVNNVVKMYLERVQKLYCQYLVIKNAPSDDNTIDACNRFIREAEMLARYDHRIASFHSTKCKYTVDWLCSEGEREYVNGVLFNAVEEIGKLLVAVRDIRDEGKFTDPVYWALAPVGEQQGADILKELEENDAEKEKDTPNAFLEEID